MDGVEGSYFSAMPYDIQREIYKVVLHDENITLQERIKVYKNKQFALKMKNSFLENAKETLEKENEVMEKQIKNLNEEIENLNRIINRTKEKHSQIQQILNSKY